MRRTLVSVFPQKALVMRRTLASPLLSADVATPALPDIVVTPAAALGRVVTVTVPTFDPAAVGVPDTITASYLAAAPDPAATADQIVASAAFTLAVPFPGSAGDLAITVPSVTPGSWTVAVTLEFPL